MCFRILKLGNSSCKISNLGDASFRMSKMSWGEVRLFFRIFIHSGSRCWWCYKKGWWWCFSVFLESLILTVCWYGTGRFINSKVTPHVRKSWGCEGFRTLRRESRFSSLLWDLLWRSFCQDDDGDAAAEKENWDRVVVHAFSSQSHYGLSQLTLRHFHYSLLNT